jgi:glycerophosphoryl diester phosphodiesterase
VPFKVQVKVYEMVRSMKAQAWIDYISFDYNICLELMRLDPHARVAYLNGDKSPEQLLPINYGDWIITKAFFKKIRDG